MEILVNKIDSKSFREYSHEISRINSRYSWSYLTKGTGVSPLRDFPMIFIDLGRLRAVWDSPKSMKTIAKSSKWETHVPFVRYLHEYWELIRDISCEHSLIDLLSILFCRIFILARWFSVQKNSQIPEGWCGTCSGDYCSNLCSA